VCEAATAALGKHSQPRDSEDLPRPGRIYHLEIPTGKEIANRISGLPGNAEYVETMRDKKNFAKKDWKGNT
jgi:hypothetical protein